MRKEGKPNNWYIKYSESKKEVKKLKGLCAKYIQDNNILFNKIETLETEIKQLKSESI